MTARKIALKRPASNKFTVANIFFWILIISAPIAWVGFGSGVFVINNQFIKDWYNAILAVPVLGLVVLHFMKDPVITRLSKSFSDFFYEKDFEEKDLATRDEAYRSNHPGFSRVFILGNFGKWIHKNGVVFTLLLSLLFANGLLIRSSNLDSLPLQNDEFLSYGAIKYIADGHITLTDLKYGSEVNQSQVFYSRALPYSLGAALTVKLLGGDYMDYSNLRMFSVICGLLTLVVFYFLLRKYFTRPVLFFSLFGVSTMYLLVYHSRVARMYSFHILLFFLMFLLFDRVFSKITKDRITRYVGIHESAKYYFHFVKNNILSILLFAVVFIVDLKVHNTGLFIVPIIFFYAALNLKAHRQLLYPVLIATLVSVFCLVIFFATKQFIPEIYFNSSGKTYWEFLNYNFIYLYGGYLTIPLFLLPLVFIQRVPSIIKLCYTAFFVVVPAYIFLLNGNMFRDPRYMLFIYPLYVIVVVYSLYLLAALIFQKITVLNSKVVRTGALSVFFIFFLSPIQIHGVCRNLPFIVCPESHPSKIFHIDRWNYNHDEYFQIIKKNASPNTIIISRSVYNFYIEKYKLTNAVLRLADSTKPYIEKEPEYSISDLKKKDIIFIDYPKLYYDSAMTAPHDQVYQYLLKKRTGKKVLYRSVDDKVVVYKIDRSVKPLD